MSYRLVLCLSVLMTLSMSMSMSMSMADADSISISFDDLSDAPLTVQPDGGTVVRTFPDIDRFPWLGGSGYRMTAGSPGAVGISLDEGPAFTDVAVRVEIRDLDPGVDQEVGVALLSADGLDGYAFTANPSAGQTRLWRIEGGVWALLGEAHASFRVYRPQVLELVRIGTQIVGGFPTCITCEPFVVPDASYSSGHPGLVVLDSGSGLAEGTFDDFLAYSLMGEDADGDAVPDEFDNCVNHPNGPFGPGSQFDADRDGFGNVCDCDFVPVPGDGFILANDIAELFLSFASDSGYRDVTGDGFTLADDVSKCFSRFNTRPG